MCRLLYLVVIATALTISMSAEETHQALDASRLTGGDLAKVPVTVNVPHHLTRGLQVPTPEVGAVRKLDFTRARITGPLYFAGQIAEEARSTTAARFPAPPASSTLKRRDKRLTVLGLGMIGAGVAMMAFGPTSTSRAAYTTSYNVKVAGGIVAAGGGSFLYLGLKPRH